MMWNNITIKEFEEQGIITALQEENKLLKKAIEKLLIENNNLRKCLEKE